MKYFCPVFLMLVLLLACVSCTDGGGDETFVYYFASGANPQRDGVVLHAVMRKNEKKKSESGDEPFAESFEGADVKEAFSLFFEKYKNAYTNTVKEYGICDKEGYGVTEDFKVYLTNSPGLPVKKKTLIIRNVDEYVAEKLAELSR
ncbi:MAG: hypothetical protein IJZ20_02105 [Clostridia bacterium]|nr:hypothetical protein [Clostridia bacterium]